MSYSAHGARENDPQLAAPPRAPTFLKVWVMTAAAAVTPWLVRMSIQWGIPIETEDAKRVAVFVITGLATLAAGFFTSEPVRNVQAYLASKRA